MPKMPPPHRLCDAIRAEALNRRSVTGRVHNHMLNVQKPKKSLDAETARSMAVIAHVGATTYFEQSTRWPLTPSPTRQTAATSYTDISAVLVQPTRWFFRHRPGQGSA